MILTCEAYLHAVGRSAREVRGLIPRPHWFKNTTVLSIYLVIFNFEMNIYVYQLSYEEKLDLLNTNCHFWILFYNSHCRIMIEEDSKYNLYMYTRNIRVYVEQSISSEDDRHT